MTRITMSNDNIIEDVTKVIDYLDKLVYMLKEYDNSTREQDIAIQKLEEAIFWLSYGAE